MDIELIMNLIIFICALIGAVYGIYNFFRPKKAMYLQMITSGVTCLMFAELFSVIYIATQEELFGGYHVGMLGIIGSFMFFLSANYGQMDGLVDDKSSAFIKTRITALIIPFVLAAVFAGFCFMNISLEIKIAVGVVTAFIIPCAYYNFKHIIIYDVEVGIIRSIRKYNILAVLYAFLIMFKFIGEYGGIMPLYIGACAGVALVSLIILPVLKGGVAAWTI